MQPRLAACLQQALRTGFDRNGERVVSQGLAEAGEQGPAVVLCRPVLLLAQEHWGAGTEAGR